MTYTCPVCHTSRRDEPWATLAGPNPGPRWLAIGRARHGMTGLDAMGIILPDDEGNLRCVTCLRAVPGGRRSFTMTTGYELLCCGATEEEQRGAAAEVEARRNGAPPRKGAPRTAERLAMETRLREAVADVTIGPGALVWWPIDFGHGHVETVSVTRRKDDAATREALVAEALWVAFGESS